MDDEGEGDDEADDEFTTLFRDMGNGAQILLLPTRPAVDEATLFEEWWITLLVSLMNDFVCKLCWRTCGVVVVAPGEALPPLDPGAIAILPTPPPPPPRVPFEAIKVLLKLASTMVATLTTFPCDAGSEQPIPSPLCKGAAATMPLDKETAVFVVRELSPISLDGEFLDESADDDASETAATLPDAAKMGIVDGTSF